MSGHIQFMEDNLLHAISNLQYLQFHVVAKSSSYSLSSIVPTANLEIRKCVKWSLVRGCKNNGKVLNCQPRKVAAVAYSRQSFRRDSICKALTGNEILVFWIGGRLLIVVAYERWSHMDVQLTVLNFTIRKYCWFSHDVTKIQTKKLSILPRFYFHDALEQLKTNFHTNVRFKRVLGFVIA